MARWVAIARVDDVTPGTGSVVHLDLHDIALFRVGDTFYALGNACPHRGQPLGMGGLEGHIVTCPGHGYPFDVRTGRTAWDPELCARVIPVRVVEGWIEVEV